MWIEPMFAEAKQWHGMDRVRLRTLERVNTTVLITASGQNGKRLLSSGGRGPRKPAQVAALRPPGRPRLLRFRHRPATHRGVSQHAGWLLYVSDAGGHAVVGPQGPDCRARRLGAIHHAAPEQRSGSEPTRRGCDT